MLLAPLLLAVPARASCTASDVEAALDGAERSFVSEDARELQDEVREVERLLGCVHDPVPAALCARVHRARALAAHLSGDAASLEVHLRAMLHAAPMGEVPADLVPPGHAVRTALVAAEEAPLSLVPAPKGSWLLVDGIRTRVVPQGQPYVLQRARLDGTTTGARLVEASAGSGGGAPAGGRVAVRWTGLGLGVVSAGLYGAAWAQRAAYDSAVAARDDPRIGRTYTATNALSVGAVAAAGLGSALVVGSLTLR